MRDDLRLSLHAVDLIDRIAATGLTLRQSADLAAFEEAYSVLGGANKDAPPPLNSAFVDIDPSDFFWLQVADGDGVIRGTVAARREFITRPLAEHLNSQYLRLYKGDGPLKITGHAPAAWQISGNIVYHGGLLVGDDLKRGGIGRWLSQLSIIAAHSRWYPDFHWAYVEKKLIDTGFHIKVGYYYAQEMGVHFDGIPKDVPPDDYLIWIDREGVNYRISLDRQRKGSAAAVLAADARG